MRHSHAFRPDALDHLLEDRCVLSQLTALAPLFSTFNTDFGIGTQFNPAMTGGSSLTSPSFLTGLSSPLFSTGTGTGSLGGLGFNTGLSLSPGLGFNGLTGFGLTPSTTGLTGVSGASLIPTGLSGQIKKKHRGK